MTRRLLATYLSLTVLVLLMLELPLAITFAHNERQDLSGQIERDAVAMTTLVEDALEQGASPAAPEVKAAADRYQRATGGRVIVVDQRGDVVIDSAGILVGQSAASRPELAQALRGTVAAGTRYSHTLGTGLLFVAVPVASGGAVHGAVRITYPMSAVDRRVHHYWLTLGLIGLIVLLTATLVGWRFARRVTRPLQAVERAAWNAEEGDLASRAPVGGPPEVRSLATSFNAMVTKLDDIVRAEQAFVADASHQLRTPLAALRLMLENLESEVADPADMEAAIREVDRLSRTVDGLLAMARADSARQASAAIDLRAVVDERVVLWSALARQHEVDVASRLGRPLGVLASAERLEQVLDNLIANALDASPPGGSIEISAGEDDRWVALHVIDQGPGMSDEERERAFDRFWSGRAAQGGSGLGLAIVRRLVDVDGGKVELRRAATGGIDAVVHLARSVQPEPAPSPGSPAG